VNSTKVSIDSIRIENRYRKNNGNLSDLQDLADSIKAIGLLHPVVLGPRNQLIAGERRIKACQLIGWKTIPATRVDSMSDAIQQLYAQRDENTCRVAFTPSEAVALGEALEALERPRAEARERLGKKPCGILPQGKTRDIVGAAIGMSGKTYEMAKAVVKAAEVNKELAPIVAKMDETGNVAEALRKLRSVQAGTPDAPTAPPTRSGSVAAPESSVTVVMANGSQRRLTGNLECVAGTTINLQASLANAAKGYNGKEVQFLLAVKTLGG
jgi:ParB-like chromosome segregation protein Spo0J